VTLGAILLIVPVHLLIGALPRIGGTAPAADWKLSRSSSSFWSLPGGTRLAAAGNGVAGERICSRCKGGTTRAEHLPQRCRIFRLSEFGHRDACDAGKVLRVTVAGNDRFYADVQFIWRLLSCNLILEITYN
jgi:hypothetical protein